MKEKNLFQTLKELLSSKSITSQKQQEILKQLEQSGVLTEEEISPENLKKIAEKIRLDAANKERKSNNIDNKKVLYNTLGGLALIAF